MGTFPSLGKYLAPHCARRRVSERNRRIAAALSAEMAKPCKTARRVVAPYEEEKPTLAARRRRNTPAKNGRQRRRVQEAAPYKRKRQKCPSLRMALQKPIFKRNVVILCPPRKY